MFSRLKGVKKVESGYAGGHSRYPSYSEVKSQKTGHAEVIMVNFDPKIVRYESNSISIQLSYIFLCMFMIPQP